jgi:peptidoglycan/xylan/chitin deacetylase (PgdA/CDA1 family)
VAQRDSTAMARISILMYHQVGEFARPAAHRSTYCHIRRFRAQMAYLHKAGIPVLALPDAFAILCEGRPFQGHGVVLTFDDGDSSFADYAHPVLARYGFPASVFIVSALIGQPAAWFGIDGREMPRIMDGTTIRALRKQSVNFGPHTLSHPRLSREETSRIVLEVEQSKAQMESLLDEPMDFFCYPYGDYDHRVIAAVKNAGFRGALSCIRGSAAPGQEDPYQLPRKAISYGDTLPGFCWKLHVKHRKKQTSPEY